ncbi:hypothetical protein SSX86_020021 [Deinandra increscens subsp. villosa]|uniref:NB-ARC domain-containing protein n=1 Tax=Deinandra increscens subsp. villosa TaxID=3103831 RepID=A0AAP0CTP8_9ASTR
MEIVTPVVTPVVESLMVRVKKELGFWFSSKNYVMEMHARFLVLNHKADDLKRKKEANGANNLEVPNHVPHWLTQVDAISSEVEDIPNGEIRCFIFTKRYKAGKRSYDILKKIVDLENEESNIKWTNEPIPLGKVINPIMPSTSEPFRDDKGIPNMFMSRQMIFKNVLKSLEVDSNTQQIALCGMGGVGKTTMMEELKKVVEKRGMFKWVIKVIIGQKADLIAIQQAIAQYMGEPLNETTRDARATRLQKRFEGISENGTKNILVILDDVWKELDLKDIGLTSPLPNSFKLLITSRDEKVCIKMDIKPSSIFKVVGLEKAEAKVLFWETVGSPDGTKEELHNIGEDILNKCDGLPLAIKTIALTLRGEEKDAWKVALLRLQRHDPDDLYDIVGHIFDISYDNLRTMDKSVFILCGLYPDDFNISKEELMIYGWGLKFFKSYHLMEARHQTNTSVSNLIHANLLIESDTIGYVRMHDLARAFVLSNFSKFKQASVITHGDELEWPTEDTRESCERILVNCAGMSEFSQGFNYPSLSLLKLMNGDRILKFSTNFHKRMKKLEVMAYDKMENPLRAVSLCDSMNLRTLCFHSCSLVDNDISCLGNLVNLEVLSIAHCGIRKLPSTIGKLRKLKLLDLTGCVDLCIDEGVFQNLDKFGELYLRVLKKRGIRFTDANHKELEMLLPKFYALEIEFFENILQWKNVSFEKLERFRISLGCFLNVNTWDNYPLKNTLSLVTNWSDLLECKITTLFSKTEELLLSVKDMRCFEDISMSPSQYSQFCNLKVLHVFECPDLTHLFTIPVINVLNQLESLKVSSCNVLKSLVLVPKLSKLTVNGLAKLKQIWDCDTTSSGEEDVVSMLRKIEVNNCESVVNIFPRNPMRLLRNLEKVSVRRCCSIQILFNIDMNKEQLSSSNTSSLRRIKVEGLEELREVWKINDENNSGHLIRGFQAVETIRILECKKLRNVFTPTTANLDLGALVEMDIRDSGENNVELVNDSQEEELCNISFEGITGVSVVFEIESPPSINNNNRELLLPTTHQQQSPILPLLPSLEVLHLYGMEMLSHVWKCSNWNEFFILHQHQTQSSSFQNLTSIALFKCKSIKYLFSPLMSKLLSNLKTLCIYECEGMEEVVSKRDDNDDEALTTTSTTTLFPCLDYISLAVLISLEHIGGGVAKGKTNVVHDELEFSQVGVVSWSLCQYSREINIYDCPALSSLIPSYAARQLQKLQKLDISYCSSMVEVFETKDINNNNIGNCSSNVDQGSDVTLLIPRTKNITMHKLPNLKSLKIYSCDLLKYTFTFSTLESLTKLKNLIICRCGAMEVIVRDENGETSFEKVVVEFPRLKSIELDDLPNLEGFFLGMNIDFQFPSLDNVKISDCPQMKVFTSGDSTAPKLNKYIHTWAGKHNLECGLNFHHQISGASSAPWFFHTLNEVYVSYNDKVKNIVPSNGLVHLQNLEKINVGACDNLKEVFEEATYSESQTVVKVSKLREVELGWLKNLEYIWKSNQWSIFEFPNLTRLSIEVCNGLEYVFTASMVGSLKQLQELDVCICEHIEVIVKKDEECDASVVDDDLELKVLHFSSAMVLNGCLPGSSLACFLEILVAGVAGTVAISLCEMSSTSCMSVAESTSIVFWIEASLSLCIEKE